MSWRLLYTVDVLAILLFVVSYYQNCYRKGYRIDFWHAQLFIGCIAPYLFMLFFARNELNAVIVGHDFGGIVAAVPTVFFLVIIGYIAILVGGSLWRLQIGLGLRKAAIQLLDVGPRCSMMLMSSRRLLVLWSMVCLCLQGLILAQYFAHDGFGFNLRAYTFANPGARPLSQITVLCSIVIASHCLARYVDTKERALLVCTLLMTFGLVFFGQRGNLVSIYVNVTLCFLVKLRGKISLLRISSLVIVLVVFVLYLGNAREGLYSLEEFFTSLVFLALYGNTFTDLRDFSWMYADWNHELWVGKTYLAGLATFVPRGASQFRATWSFGIASGWTVGLDTDLHPGLKPGQFGESFFNFGWLGVVVVGLIFGIILRRVDIDIKAAFRSSRPSMSKAFASTMLLGVAGCFSGSLALPSLYALGAVYTLSWLYLRAWRMMFPHQVGSANIK